MDNEERIIDLLEKILKRLDSIENEVSSTAMNTGDIFGMKSEIEEINGNVDKIKQSMT